MSRMIAFVAVAALAAAQQPKLDEVVGRVDRYLAQYDSRLENVVAEETYRQRAQGAPGLHLIRILRSDYALMRLSDGWIGYRDTFEVDGQPVRGRDERLRQLLSSGAVEQAKRIDEQNARYNLANDRLQRTVNRPTLALELLQPRYRKRFSVRRIAAAAIEGRLGWVLEFRERSHPTIVRTQNGRNQESRIEALVDPETGEIRRTTISWAHTTGSIVVDYSHVAEVSVPVPVRMIERFTIARGDDIDSDATYTNYRTFQTSARLLDR